MGSLLFWLLFPFALAQINNEPTESDWLDECMDGVWHVDGTHIGPVASLDYEKSELYTEVINDDYVDTFLRLDFVVPTRYTAGFEGSYMEINLHERNETQDWNLPGPDYSSIGNDSACYSSCPGGDHLCSNTTICTQGANAMWNLTAREDNMCLSDVSVVVRWEDAVNNNWIKMSYNQTINPRYSGDSVEIFFDVQISLWTEFTQFHTIIGAQDEDGGWTRDNIDIGGNPDLWMNDTRNLDYQIPFYLVFPTTVQGTFDFTIGTPITTLAVTGKTEVVNIDISAANEWGELDVTFRTSLLYPYAMRGPRDTDAPILMYAQATEGPTVTFIEWTDPSLCYTDDPNFCTQEFTVRITPTDDDPCDVSGTYVVEAWAKCVVGNTVDPSLCALNDLLDSTGTAGFRNQNNGYFTFNIDLPAHTWCPRIVDEIVVTPTLHVYHDAAFSLPIYNQHPSGVQTYDVFTNNWIWCEVTYATNSDFGVVNPALNEQDVLIDFARATRIYMDVELETLLPEILPDVIIDRYPNDVAYWEDIVSSDTVPNPLTVQNLNINDTWTQYRVELCNTHFIDSYDIYNTSLAEDDCFAVQNGVPGITAVASEMFELEKVLYSEGQTEGGANCQGYDKEGSYRTGADSDGSLNCIDENEIAWKYRLDERIIPVDPDIDNGHLQIWVESEVYYVGNHHSTRRRIGMDPAEPFRRRLQTDDIMPLPTRVQDLLVQTAFDILPPKALLKSCNVHNLEPEGTITLHFGMSIENLPSKGQSYTWALHIQTELEAWLRVENVITVVEVQRCDPACTSQFTREEEDPTRRRQEDEEDVVQMVVGFHFVSNKVTKAGRMLNSLQHILLDNTSPIHQSLTVFKTARIRNMHVNECSQDDATPTAYEPEGDSSEEVERTGLSTREKQHWMLAAAAAGFVAALIAGFCIRRYQAKKRKDATYTHYTRNGTVFTIL